MASSEELVYKEPHSGDMMFVIRSNLWLESESNNIQPLTIADDRHQGFFVTQQIAAAHYDESKFMKVSVRELLIFCTFFVLLCFVVFGTVNSPMFYYTHAMKRLYCETEFITEDGISFKMKNVTTMADTWGYIGEVLVRYIDWNFWYSREDTIAQTDMEDKNVLFNNRIIGTPRLRQVRVAKNTCTVPALFESKIKTCYGYYSPQNEDTAPYQQGQKRWTYSSASKLGTSSFTGYVATYGGGGYVEDLTQKYSTDAGIISFLINKLWLNRGTRALFIDFATYNPNINAFCFVKLIFEFPPTGGIIASSQFNTMKLIRYHGIMGIVVLMCDILVGLFTFYFIFEEVLEIIALRSDYFTSWWTLLDLTIIFLLIGFITTCIMRGMAVQFTLKKITETHEYSSFDSLISLQNAFHYIVACLVFLSILKLLRYLRMNRIIRRLLNVIYEAFPALLGFGLIFFIILFAFAFLGYILFGSEVYLFRTVFDSVFSLHLMLLGSVSYEEFVYLNRISGPIFFCSYIFFIFFIFLNMFLAILNEKFWAKGKEIDFSSRDGFGTAVKNACKSFLRLIRCSSLVDRWDQRDEEWRGIERLKKLRQSLERSGFSEAEIEAFLEKYEIDEESLAGENADEIITRLKDDLQGIGLFDTSVQDRIMNRIDGIDNKLLLLHKKIDVINLRLRL